jgi:hypothetical protein
MASTTTRRTAADIGEPPLDPTAPQAQASPQAEAPQAQAAYVMTPQLRKQLRAAITGEGWDEDEKARCRKLVDAVADGQSIPDDRTEEDEESDEAQGLPGLIEYFGVVNFGPQVVASIVITQVADLPDELRREIVTARNNGATLAELKRDYGQQVHPDVIREVLPPGNARERKAREARAPKADQTKPELSKRAKDVVAEAKAKPQAPKPEPAPKVERYLDPDSEPVKALAARIRKARERVGQSTIASLAGVAPFAVWRAEGDRQPGAKRRVTAEELPLIVAALDKIESDPSIGGRKASGAGGRPPRAGRAELEAKLDAVARALHDEWRGVKPASFRDALADIVGAPKPQEEAKS